MVVAPLNILRVADNGYIIEKALGLTNGPLNILNNS